MAECDWVWVGNLKPDATQEEMEHFLQEELRFDDFVVRMGKFDFPVPHSFCYVLFEHGDLADYLRYRLKYVWAQESEQACHTYMF